MATLTGSTIASTYTELLRLGNATLSASAGTSHYIKDSADTNSVLSINTTKVGIGTTSPESTARLEVQVESLNNWGILVTDTAGATAVGLFVNGSGGGEIQAYKNDQSTIGLRLTAEDNADSYFMSGGHVGIGIAAPLSPLHVYSSGLTDLPILHVEHGESDMESGDEILRLDASSDANIFDTTALLKIITIHDAGGEIGKLVCASDGAINTAWTDSSDVRLKKDIVDTSLDGLTLINGLKLRDFKWNAEAGSNKENRQVICSLIADEVYEIHPIATTGTPGAVKEDGSIDIMGITESRFIKVLLKAVQELSAKVEALENAN